MPANQCDAIVVGAGHNGLVAAHYLARAGLKVVVLERRSAVGGPCGRIEFFPGYFGAISNSPGALEPKIVEDMQLGRFGLKFVKPNPTVVSPFPDGRIFTAWREQERTAAELRRFSAHDAEAYYEFFKYLEWFARRLKISLFRAPPGLRELVANLTTPEDEQAFGKLFLGSIKDLLDERMESEEVKALIAILGVVSNMAGPSTPGTAYMLLQRPISLVSLDASFSDDPRRQLLRGSTGLPVGGMGAITDSMRRSIEAAGALVRTEAAVVHIRVRNNAVAGVVLANGEEWTAPLVLSNLNPKTTCLDLLDSADCDPEIRRRLQKLKMHGSAFKVALALDGLPRYAAARTDEEARLFAGCQFRIAPSMEYMDLAFDDARYGRPSARPVPWGLIPSANDPTIVPPRKHVMSVNVFHAPYHLRDGDWTAMKEVFGKRCIALLSEYMPDLPDHITDVRFWSPKDLEDEYGLVEANITHGDVVPEQMFFLRPVAGLSHYRGPVAGLYLCGSGAYPGGFVSGIPGHNASQRVLTDLRDGGTLS